VQAKEVGNVELKIIFTQNLGDGVRPIVVWMKILMGSYKEFILEVKPKCISHLKLVWHPMLIMALFVLGIKLL
jgi:hypothetical protein